MSQQPRRGGGVGDGIKAIHVNQAREMFQATIRARQPPGAWRQINTTEKAVIDEIGGGIHSSEAVCRISSDSNSSEDTKLPGNPSNEKLMHTHRCNNPHNPNCDHCGTVIIPSPIARMPLKDDPSITLGEWTITTIKRPILSSDEIDEWSDKLQFPIPEMIFGNSSVELHNEETNWFINFNPFDALNQVKLGDSGLRVAYSEDWINSKLKNSQVTTTAEGLKFGKHWDWSYTTFYQGTTANSNLGYKFERADEYELPVNKLSRRDPILFYDDFILFEDELADNGISMLSIKLRVMKERLLLLSRFFLRIDGVLFKIIDTRIYIEFSEDLVVREWKYLEDDYNSVLNKCKMNSNDPKRSLRDSNWVASVLPLKQRTCEVLRKTGA